MTLEGTRPRNRPCPGPQRLSTGSRYQQGRELEDGWMDVKGDSRPKGDQRMGQRAPLVRVESALEPALCQALCPL